MADDKELFPDRNDGFSSSQQIAPGDILQGFVDEDLDNDYYDVEFMENGAALVVLEPQGDYPFKVVVYNNYEEKIADKLGGSGEIVSFKFPVQANQIYTIRVIFRGDYENNRKAEYKLCCSQYYPEYEGVGGPHSTHNTAQMIEFGQSVLSRIGRTNSTKHDIYVFTATLTGRISAYLVLDDFDVETYFYVEDESHNEITGNEAYMGKLNKVSFNVEKGNRYFIGILNESTVTSKYVLDTEVYGVGGSPNVAGVSINTAIKYLADLEAGAKAYYTAQGKSYSNHQINEKVNAYIRYKSQRYYGGVLWGNVTKDVDESLAEVLNKAYPTTVACMNDNFLDDSGRSIDFLHLLATIGGYCYPNLAGSMLPDSFYGWAGDLASQVGGLFVDYRESRYYTPNNTSDVIFGYLKRLAEFKENCGLIDIYTDIDSEVIAYNCYTESKLLSEVLKNYYATTYKYRFDMFLNHYQSIEAMYEKINNTLSSGVSNTILSVLLSQNTRFANGGYNAINVTSVYYKGMAWKMASFIGGHCGERIE